MSGFELSGLDNLANRLDILNAAIQEKAIASLLQSGNDIKKAAIDSMNEPKTGKTYGSHTASAPGEAPAVVDGTLIKSINVRVEGTSVIIGTTLDYGTYLELGTSKVAARPWLMPAYNKIKPDIIIKLQHMNLI